LIEGDQEASVCRAAVVHHAAYSVVQLNLSFTLRKFSDWSLVVCKSHASVIVTGCVFLWFTALVCQTITK